MQQGGLQAPRAEFQNQGDLRSKNKQSNNKQTGRNQDASSPLSCECKVCLARLGATLSILCGKMASACMQCECSKFFGNLAHQRFTAHSNLTGSRQHCRDPITQNTRLPDYIYRLHLHLPFYIYPITFTRLHLHNICLPDYPITFTGQQPD